jgi:pimeloyl-ACP methyl ester carboxylesterase
VALVTLTVATILLPAGPAAGEPAGPPEAGCAGVGLAPTALEPPDRNPDGSPVAYRPDRRGKYVPVIVVHGWTGRSTHTDARDGAFSHLIDLTTNRLVAASTGRSLIGQLQRIPGAAVFTFDYHDYSGRWVDDLHLGPALGDAIDCLHRASGEKVIVIGHSMGGLIARWALTHRGAAGADRSVEVSTVLTFGTPEEGSLLAALLAAALDGAAVASPQQLGLLRLFLSTCGALATQNIESGSICDFLPSFVRAFDSGAGRALRANSAELANLAAFPRSVTLDAVAGDARFKVPRIGWFALPWQSSDISMGDLVVPAPSALHGAALSRSAACSYQLNAVRGVADAVGLALRLTSKADVAAAPVEAVLGPCFHPHLMRGIELTNEVIGAVNEDISARGVETLPAFHGLSISLPRPWKVGHVIGSGTGGSPFRDEVDVVDGRRCRHSKYLVDCPGFMIFGPTAVSRMAGFPPRPYSPEFPWHPGTGVEGCPMNRDELYESIDRTPTVKKAAPVGSKQALYREWVIKCKPSNDPSTVASTYTQRVWYLPVSKILIVDEWSTPGLAEILAKARWD